MIYSKRLRIKRLCSDGHKLQKHLENLTTGFVKEVIPGGLIDEQLQRVKGKSRESLLWLLIIHTLKTLVR